MEEKNQNPETTTVEPSNKPGGIPAIRTYSGDIQEYVQKKGTSYISAMAQAAKRKPSDSIREELAQKPYLKMALWGGAAVLFVVAIAGGAYFVFSAKKTASSTATPRTPQALIRADHEKIIAWKGGTETILIALRSALVTPQISGEFIYLPATKTENGQEQFLNSTELLQNAGVKIPQNLTDNLTGYPTLGVLDTLGRNETVFLSPISDYERVFAALLRWEPAMLTDYQAIIPQDKNLNTGKTAFEDTVIKNNDARALKNVENEIVLAYTIFNRKILIIASSKAAMEQVLERLISSPPTL